ncbi:MAG: ribosome biogenesis GTPase YlqF [Desulfotomaculaceae bacterium]|nr:ribosome biogenesis GTPase YlqF [Desulfotomaculaceae bacterium]
MDINWYPGHMAKAKRIVKESLKLVDVVIEVLDARIPASSRNPDMKEIAGQKPTLIVLNKYDLADPELTGRWIDYFMKSGFSAVAVDLIKGRGVQKIPALVRQLVAAKMASLELTGRRPRAARCIVLGIPNVGKSFLINKLTGRRAARTGYKPGVTRGRQWIRITDNLELLDTPGILWPKLEDSETAFRLAVTGAIKEEVFSLYDVAGQLIELLAKKYPEAVMKRYKLQHLPEEAGELFRLIGISRGFIGAGGTVDLLKAAQSVMKEFREGNLGRITLEQPEQ